MSERRALRSAVGVGVLAALVATGTVVVRGLGTEASDAAAASAAVVTSDVPLVNTALEADDITHVSPASRGNEREPLVEGEGVTFGLIVDGESRSITTSATTLADALAEAGVVLGWEDDVSADLSAAPEAGAEVTVARGTTQYVTEDVVTPHPTEQRETDELPLGETRVVQEGVDGAAQATSEIHLLDGQEVSRTTLLQTMTAAAVTEIVEVGTRETPTSDKLYTLRQFMSAGVVNWGGYRFTYYSQSVLPGGGLSIPGRHVNADGYVSDGDGYIVLANSSPKGTIIDTPFGYQGKVYDRGTVGNHYDVYTQ